MYKYFPQVSLYLSITFFYIIEVYRQFTILSFLVYNIEHIINTLLWEIVLYRKLQIIFEEEIIEYNNFSILRITDSGKDKTLKEKLVKSINI